MSIKLRMAAFNLENLDDKPGQRRGEDDRPSAGFQDAAGVLQRF